LRAANKPTVPTEIALERATNPFLRATDANVQARLNMSGAPAVDVFAEIRARKDSF
jgi:hydroxyacylglutathione hydrolase